MSLSLIRLFSTMVIETGLCVEEVVNRLIQWRVTQGNSSDVEFKRRECKLFIRVLVEAGEARQLDYVELYKVIDHPPSNLTEIYSVFARLDCEHAVEYYSPEDYLVALHLTKSIAGVTSDQVELLALAVSLKAIESNEALDYSAVEHIKYKMIAWCNYHNKYAKLVLSSYQTLTYQSTATPEHTFTRPTNPSGPRYIVPAKGDTVNEIIFAEYDWWLTDQEEASRVGDRTLKRVTLNGSPLKYRVSVLGKDAPSQRTNRHGGKPSIWYLITLPDKNNVLPDEEAEIPFEAITAPLL